MFSFIIGLIKVTTPILFILNFFAGIVGGGWLLFSGEWKLIILTVLISLFIPTLYSIVTMPLNYLFGAGMSFFANKRKKALVIIFSAISILINNIIELIWVFLVFIYAVAIAETSSISMIPYLLYGYAFATGPFNYMASKEPKDSIGTHIGVYFIEISYVILSILLLVNGLVLALPVILVLTVLLLIFLLKNITEIMDLEWGTFSKKKEIEMCITEFNNISQELSASAKEIVKPVVFDYLKDTEKTLYSLQKDKISPRNLIFLLITNAIAEILPTGHYHIYRGVLSQVGHDLLKLFDYAVNELEEKGCFSHEEAKEDKAWIREQINGVG